MRKQCFVFISLLYQEAVAFSSGRRTYFLFAYNNWRFWSHYQHHIYTLEQPLKSNDSPAFLKELLLDHESITVKFCTRLAGKNKKPWSQLRFQGFQEVWSRPPSRYASTTNRFEPVARQLKG
jgi:hypothetical protein